MAFIGIYSFPIVIPDSLGGILPQRLDKLYDPDIKLFTKPAFM